MWLKKIKLLSFALLFIALSTTLPACNEEDPSGEIVYLYVFNAYSGSKAMTIYGPTGTIVSNLGFGERTETPVAVDRNLGSNNFMLVFDGAPEEVVLPVELFAMYPQETGTLLVKKRTDLAGADVILYRHVQSIAPSDPGIGPDQWSTCAGATYCVPHTCRLVFDNALSAMQSGVANFNFVTAFKLPPEQANYLDDGRQIVTNPQTGATSRLVDAVAADPYFIPVEDPDNPGALIYVWAQANVDYQGGNVLAWAPTPQFLECVGDEEDGEGEEEEGNECDAPQSYTGHVFSTDPGVEAYYYTFSPLLGEDPESCGFPVRIISDFWNIFSGDHGNGEYIEDEISFTPGQHYFWVLYGRPVNPLIEQWASSESSTGGGFVELPPYYSTAPVQ